MLFSVVFPTGGTRAGGQAAAVSSAGSVSAGSRPGLSVVQVHFQAFEVQQTEAISLRVAYVSHLSLIPVSNCKEHRHRVCERERDVVAPLA